MANLFFSLFQVSTSWQQPPCRAASSRTHYYYTCDRIPLNSSLQKPMLLLYPQKGIVSMRGCLCECVSALWFLINGRCEPAADILTYGTRPRATISLCVCVCVSIVVLFHLSHVCVLYTFIAILEL